MDAISKFQLLADLTHEFCELNHGPATRRENFPACDYIIMPFGYKESSVVEVSVREMLVPVCLDCAMALQSGEWTLLYCFECCSSQWVYRQLAKNSYRHHILWLRGCPHCSSESEFGGLYFNDLGTIVNFSGIKGQQAA